MRHARRLEIQLAEVAATRGLFRECWIASAGYVRHLAEGRGLLHGGWEGNHGGSAPSAQAYSGPGSAMLAQAG